MPTYRITRMIESAGGSQTYLVDVDNADEAVAKHNRGESEFELEEIDVMDTSFVSCDLATDLPDASAAAK